jgi:D-alanyl-D-alanine endopeptidase (penicillin-binding protein 7)
MRATSKIIRRIMPLIGLIVLTCVSALPAATQFAHLEGSPDLRSASALVIGAGGELIYGKDIDTVRPIASITKLMTAMVILDAGLDLTAPITVTRADRDLVQLTGSRLEYGATLTRREMILLSIMSSENRAAAALARTWPDGPDAFIRQMNSKAAELGMAQSHFADPAGLRVENSTTRRLEVRPYPNRGPLHYSNTNRLLKNKNWNIALSKTGYINESGRCLVMQANIEGEPVSIVLLDSFGKLTPFGDSNRLRRWLLAGR